MTQRKLVVMSESEIPPPGDVGLVRATGAGPLTASMIAPAADLTAAAVSVLGRSGRLG